LKKQTATVFAPATVGNVGPGFDVLGLAVDGIGDTVTVELTAEPSRIVSITGRDADLIPTDLDKNVAAIAALALLRSVGERRVGVAISLHKGLALSGGMGGSAASSVGGALAAAMALGINPPVDQLLKAALAGEAAVAGRHLDNIAPCLLGGLILVRSAEDLDVIPVSVDEAWWVALVTPQIRIETQAARQILPMQLDRTAWVQQMANTAGVVTAFTTGNRELLKRSMVDLYAEPRRASLIPRLQEVKDAASAAGALGCSISGSGPTVFAIASDERSAHSCARAMQKAFANVSATYHVGPVGRGARAL
jgi:homoserine kinase